MAKLVSKKITGRDWSGTTDSPVCPTLQKHPRCPLRNTATPPHDRRVRTHDSALGPPGPLPYLAFFFLLFRGLLVSSRVVCCPWATVSSFPCRPAPSRRPCWPRSAPAHPRPSPETRSTNSPPASSSRRRPAPPIRAKSSPALRHAQAPPPALQTSPASPPAPSRSIRSLGYSPSNRTASATCLP